jgi:hypothetical protein
MDGRVWGLCPKCFGISVLTRHHIFPRRYYKGRGPILFICRSCHNKLESEIPDRIRLTEDRYIEIVRDFLAEGR